MMEMWWYCLTEVCAVHPSNRTCKALTPLQRAASPSSPDS